MILFINISYDVRNTQIIKLNNKVCTANRAYLQNNRIDHSTSTAVFRFLFSTGGNVHAVNATKKTQRW